MGIGRSVASVVLATGLACAAMGATLPSPRGLARLDADLTPVGAERAGNAAEHHPHLDRWLAQRTLDPDIGYIDSYADDRVLFTITAATRAQTMRRPVGSQPQEMFEQFPPEVTGCMCARPGAANWPEAVLERSEASGPLAAPRGL